MGRNTQLVLVPICLFVLVSARVVVTSLI